MFNFLKKKKSPKIGLALGGGAAWGIGHIGVIKALEEKNIEISYISGTSVGAIIGALFADGNKSSTIENLLCKTSWINLGRPTLSSHGFFSNGPMENFLRKYLVSSSIETLEKPFACVALDLDSGKAETFKKGDITSALRASCAIPGIFKPMVIGGKTFVDGGITASVPVSAARDLGAEYVISVNLLSEFDNWHPSPAPEIILKTFLISQYAASKIELNNSDLLINLPTGNYNPVDIKGCHGLIEESYKLTLELLSKNGF